MNKNPSIDNKVQPRKNAFNKHFNSHFVFNSLNTLEAYILREDKKAASTLLKKISRLFRLIMRYSRYDLITLYDELRIVQTYMDIELERFSNKFEYDIQISPRIDQVLVKVPSMLIQQITEYVIWKSLSRKTGSSTIILNFYYSRGENYLMCMIKEHLSNQKEYKESKVSDNVGKEYFESLIDQNNSDLKNIRLQSYYLSDSLDNNIGSIFYLYLPTNISSLSLHTEKK